MDESRIKYLNHNEIHHELLNLLCAFDSLCKEHNLVYSLSAGTLLGAIRHQGFIPWDDDVDVCMPRPDYEKLLSLSRMPDKRHALFSNRNSNMIFPFSKFCNLSIRAQEPNYEGILDEYLWIDVIPFDGVESNSEAFIKRFKRIQHLLFLRTRCSFDPFRNNGKLYKKLAKAAFKSAFTRIVSLSSLDKRIDELSSKVSIMESALMSDLVFPAETPWTIGSDGFLNMNLVKFEGKSFPAISNWDEYLTKAYGDYMQLPPIENQKSHHIAAWRTT